MDETITALIESAVDGDAASYERLFTRVYAELKLLARRQLRAGANPTLDTTSLVHDAYLKLARPETLALQSRRHFFALAAKAMRQIVIDHARARAAAKRGAGEVRVVPREDAAELAGTHVGPDRLLQLDRALSELERRMPRLSSLIEMRLFGGMELAEIAALQEVSERTLNRDWRRARAELYAALYG
jgi:RNA polymerase sigma factor (TIGR02999 family)